MEQDRGTIWNNFLLQNLIAIQNLTAETPIFQTFPVFHIISKSHEQEFDSPRLHHQKPPKMAVLLFHVKHFGTMMEQCCFFDRYRYFVMCQRHKIANNSPASYQQVKHRLTNWLIHKPN